MCTAGLVTRMKVERAHHYEHACAFQLKADRVGRINGHHWRAKRARFILLSTASQYALGFAAVLLCAAYAATCAILCFWEDTFYMNEAVGYGRKQQIGEEEGAP